MIPKNLAKIALTVYLVYIILYTFQRFLKFVVAYNYNIKKVDNLYKFDVNDSLKYFTKDRILLDVASDVPTRDERLALLGNFIYARGGSPLFSGFCLLITDAGTERILVQNTKIYRPKPLDHSKHKKGKILGIDTETPVSERLSAQFSEFLQIFKGWATGYQEIVIALGLLLIACVLANKNSLNFKFMK